MVPIWTIAFIWATAVFSGIDASCLYDALTIPGGAVSLDRGCAKGSLVAEGKYCSFGMEGYECDAVVCMGGGWIGSVVCRVTAERGVESTPVKIALSKPRDVDTVGRIIAEYMGVGLKKVSASMVPEKNQYTISVLFRGGDCALKPTTPGLRICGMNQTCWDSDGLPNNIFECRCDPPLTGATGYNSHGTCGVPQPGPCSLGRSPCFPTEICQSTPGLNKQAACVSPPVGFVDINGLHPESLAAAFVTMTSCCPYDCFSAREVYSPFCTLLSVSHSFRHPCGVYTNRVQCEVTNTSCEWVDNVCIAATSNRGQGSSDNDLHWYEILLLSILCIEVAVVVIGFAWRWRWRYQQQPPKTQSPREVDDVIHQEPLKPLPQESTASQPLLPPPPPPPVTFDSLRPHPIFVPDVTPIADPVETPSPSPRWPREAFVSQGDPTMYY
eukprot:TRINITY_DN42882_c0_g1_i1.p1 TRINITY_DN42882_c0_g1~~TRINITY_DN42882_c0_g1_i1.p1  ORF type:complete len:440 (+),score=6.77 TRINITY_DN42882_c0_g1_i1:75-1394(+)